MRTLILLLLTAISSSPSAWAAGPPQPMQGSAPAQAQAEPSRGPAATGSTEVDKPLEVKGQTRTLSMRLILKNGKDRIQFVENRKDFRSEILSTGF